MIDIKTLCSTLETKLNTYSALHGGRTFRIVPSIADITAAKRVENSNDYTEYTFGIMSVVSSTLTPLSGLSIANLTVSVDILCDYMKQEKDNNGHWKEADEVQTLIDGFVQTNNAESANGMLVNYSLTTVGDAENMSIGRGRVMPISFSIYYTYIDGGVNSSDVQLYIDGMRVYTTDLTHTNLKNTESVLGDDESDENMTETISLEQSIGIDFTAPLTSDSLGGVFRAELEATQNSTMHLVTLVYSGNTVVNRLMMMSRIVAKAQPPLIVGVSASLVPLSADVPYNVPANAVVDSPVNIDTSAVVVTENAHGDAAYTLDVSSDYYFDVIPSGNDNTLLIDWGDNNYSVTTASAQYINPTHIYSAPGTYCIIVYYFAK